MADTDQVAAPVRCGGTRQIDLGPQGAYSFVRERYAPCPGCPDCEPKANENADRCPVCGGLNPGDVTHARC